MKKQLKDQISLRRLTRLFLRLSTGLFLLVLAWSCTNVPGLQEESPGSYIRIPFVRVLLTESSDPVSVSADGAFAIECLKDGEQEVYYASQSVKLENRAGLLNVVNRKGDYIREQVDEVNIIPRGGSNRLRLNKKKYRGILRVLPRGETVRFINIVYMEDYLKGVVPPEIGPRVEGEIEAVKAQAVAARTYAMAHLRQYQGEQYDIKSSIMDQLYDGFTVEDKLVNRAISETAGRVATYQDGLINAYYHSTCGGRTDDIQDVWERKEEGYLKSVPDDKACSWSKYYTWREVFTEQQLRGRIEQYLASDRGRDIRIGKILDVTVSERTAGGRVKNLLVRTDFDVFRFQKDRIRWVVGRTSNPDLILPSDRFDVEVKRDTDANVRSVIFVGRGYGHGVGMCQCGAIGHSREGWTFDEILRHYYSGIEIKRLY